MTNVYTLRLAVNGSEVDDSVIGDNVPWVEKASNIRTTEGGGNWIKPAEQVAATLTLNIPITAVPAVETVTIGVQGPLVTYTSTWPYYTHESGDEYYRIVFHGHAVGGSKVQGINQPLVQINAVSQMQTRVMERRARTAASPVSGPRSLTTDIETAHSLTIGNNTMVPQAADFYDLDRPKQESATNGEWLKSAMAGTGSWITADWDGTMTSPSMNWRTDRYWGGTPNHNTIIPAGRPWHYVYTDTGTTWDAHPGRLEIDGGGVPVWGRNTGWGRIAGWGQVTRPPIAPTFYGWAELGDATYRNRLKEARLSTWIDTKAQCEDAARYILRRIGEPTYLHMYRIGFPIEHMYRDITTDATYTAGSEEDYVHFHASVMCGDQMRGRHDGAAFDDSDGGAGDHPYGLWPATAPVGGQVYDELAALWMPVISNDGNTDTATYFNVRSVWREWIPDTGWYVEVALEPDDAAPTMTDTGNANY